MLRSAWIIISASVVTFFCSVAAIVSGLISPYSRATNGVVRFWAGSLLKIAGIRLEVNGLEHVKSDQPYIFMGNHQSTFDIMTCLYVIPGTARFLAKQELFRIPVFAQGMRAVGMIPVDRGNRQKAHHSLEKAVEEINNGVSVIIFPEGTRSRDGNIQAFKKGGFVLALKGGIPIVPMVLSGAREIMQKQNLRLSKGRIRIDFLEPVETAELSYDNRNQLIDQVRDRIVARYTARNQKES